MEIQNEQRQVPAWWDLVGMLVEGQFLRAGLTLFMMWVLGALVSSWLGLDPRALF